MRETCPGCGRKNALNESPELGAYCRFKGCDYERRIYRGFTIEPIDHGDQPFLINGHPVRHGFILVKDHMNVSPGAAWYRTTAEAKRAADALIAVNGDAVAWWKLMQPGIGSSTYASDL